MRKLCLRKPSPALVISCIALFVALSGSSYAVIVLPKGSVGTKQLKKNAVTSAKVKNNALTGADVNEATLALPPVPSTAGLEQTVQGLQARVAELEAKLAAVTYDPATKIFRFNGVNVQVVDGTGDTGGTPNGFGNLIVGYNADGSIPDDPDVRTGSHNVVIGDEHTYSRSGGLVSGINNSITGEWASVTGGYVNVASGHHASVSGGFGNTASGSAATVTGGGSNTASGSSASVSGGNFNIASGDLASVSGGSGNTANVREQWLGGSLEVRTAQVTVPGAGSVEGNGAYFTRAISKVCNAGELLLSGGGYWQAVTGVDDDGKELPLIHSRVLDAKDGWSVRGGNDTNADRILIVQALCLGP